MAGKTEAMLPPPSRPATESRRVWYSAGTMQRRPHYGYLILALAVLSVFCALGLGRFGYAMVLPAMQEQLGLTNAQTGILQSWNLLGYLLTVAVTGGLAAHYGPRRVITLALLVLGLAMLATGLFPNFRGVAVGRFLAGAAGAAANVPAMGLVTSWFASRRRGLATGTAVAGSSLGLIVTGSLVPVILDHWGTTGWQVCWGVFGAVSLVACVVCALLIRNRPDEMGLGMIGRDENKAATTPPVSGARLAWGSVYRSAYLWHLAAVYFAFGFAYIIYSTFFVKHLVREMGFSTAAAGGMWFKVGVISAVSGFVWGAVSDRIGRRFALIAIFLIQGVSFLVMGVTDSRSGVLLSAGLFALTAWSIPAIVAAMAADGFGTRLAPAALGVATIVFGLGQALGPYLAGILADRTQSFAVSFLLAGASALVLGAGGALLLPSKAPAKPH